ncbi:TPA_asm: P3 [Argyranthemum gammacytorhabdovirus 1]|nr:TPA_asm: P3 [Argyranthemum gammacytorhabdovirus 1]
MIFSTNFPVLVKSKLAIKQGKIQNFGKNGEINVNKWKTKVYMITKPAKMKYVEVRSINILWVPTVPHMLTETQLSIKVSDARGSTQTDASDKLLTVNKSASSAWELTSPCSITFPIKEINHGLPLSMDIDIPAGNIKTDIEIGVLTISFNISSCKAVEKFFMGPVKFKYSDDTLSAADSISWKGMTKNVRDITSITDDSITRVSAIVTRYLSGTITAREMVELLDGRMWIC